MLTVFLFTGCQSTEDKKIENPLSFKVKPHNSEVVDIIDLDKLAISQVPIKEQELSISLIDPFTNRDKIVTKQEKINDIESILLNKQACRDNVKVTYRVIDQNAVSGVFHAKVQAQGVILSLSQDQKDIKLRSTGWFTTNQNLQKWQPFLKKPPLNKSILLKIGSEFWDSKNNWYLCGVN